MTHSTLAGMDVRSEPATKEEQQPANPDSANPGSLTLRSQRARAEITAIRQALEQTGWIRKRAARLLAISYRSLLYKIEQYKITRPSAAIADEPAMLAESQGAGRDRRIA
jgi:DNA-binding NtrC family response regulator